VKTSIKLP